MAKEHPEPDSISAVLQHIISEAARLGEVTPEEKPARLAVAARDLDSLLQDESIRELLLELRHSAQNINAGAERRPSYLALAKQSASSTLQVTFVVPAGIAIFCFLLSFPLQALEDWTRAVSFTYLIATACGINPVGEAQNVAPQSCAGAILLGVVGAWSLGFAGYVVGRIAELRPFQSYLSFLTRLGKAGDFSHLWVMFLQVFALGPAMVFGVAALLGAALAVAEGWTFGDGFLYILGDTTGQPNPFVASSPRSLFGMRFTIACAVWGYVVCSTIIGLASNLVLPGVGTAVRRAIYRRCFLRHTKVFPSS